MPNAGPAAKMQHKRIFIEKSRAAGILILLLNDAVDPLKPRNDPRRVVQFFEVTRIFAHNASMRIIDPLYVFSTISYM